MYYYKHINSNDIYITAYDSNDTNLTIPSTLYGNNVKKIGNFAFSNCQSIQEIKIPESITEIGFCAFLNCNNLEKVNIPNTVYRIGAGAFENCYNLKEIKLPTAI